MRQSNRCLFFIPMVFLFVLSIFSITVPSQAFSPVSDRNIQNRNNSIFLQASTATPVDISTPTPIPMEFSAQELAESRPTGIIIGAAALVIFIFLGTFITIRRTNKNK